MSKIIIMKKISLFIIVDYIFKFTLLFLINFIWCAYFIETSFIAVMVAIFISCSLILAFNFFGSKKHYKKQISLKEEQKIADITRTFVFMTKDEILNFFYKLASTKHECKVKDEYIEIMSDQKPIILYPIFKSENISLDDMIYIYKKIKNRNIKRFVVLTNKYDNIDASAFKFETLILNYKETYYKLLKAYEFYPEITIKNKPKIKNSLNSILLIALNKKKSKGYFISALFILFASFFVRFKIYYLIFSTILLFLALFSRFNISYNKLEKIKVID